MPSEAVLAEPLGADPTSSQAHYIGSHIIQAASAGDIHRCRGNTLPCVDTQIPSQGYALPLVDEHTHLGRVWMIL